VFSVKDMTQKQALAEAVRRWGAGGAVRFRATAARNGQKGRGRLARYRCTVGNGGLGKYRSIEGQGDTWREAFDDAGPAVAQVLEAV
jgi:hypothetical protein